jgi:hypothetical protein
LSSTMNVAFTVLLAAGTRSLSFTVPPLVPGASACCSRVSNCQIDQCG